MLRKFFQPVLLIGLGMFAWASLEKVQGNAFAQDQAPLAPIGTAFTYQGSLTDGDQLANGAYDFQFTLFDAGTGGSLVGSVVEQGDVAVTNGVFTTALDFGPAAFTGSARYLEVAVRPAGSAGSYTTLTPRQNLTPAPYSLFAANADQLDGLDSSSFFRTSGGTVSGNLSVTGTITGMYGAGVPHGGSSVTKRFWAGSLPYNTTNTNQKLLVTVWGGTWENNTLGQDFYSISSRMGLKISRTRFFGATSKHQLVIYDNGASYDVVVEVIAQAWPNLVVRSQKMESAGGFYEVAVTEGYDPSGKTPVTPALENHIVVDNAGNVGIGTGSPARKLDIAGTTRTDILEIDAGSDLAELFSITGGAAVQAGMVVVIDPEQPGKLRLSSRAYDRAVAGCVSGAGGVNAGLVLQQKGSAASGEVPVALTGRVYCWADASYGPIRPGDLLTTSATPGHLMAASDSFRAQGAIIGKAMTGLEQGFGLILVLISLQ